MSTVCLQKDFVTTLRAMMKDKGVTQTELSRRSGVAISTISNILAEKAEPSLSMCDKLIAALSNDLEITFSFSAKKTA